MDSFVLELWLSPLETFFLTARVARFLERVNMHTHIARRDDVSNGTAQVLTDIHRPIRKVGEFKAQNNIILQSSNPAEEFVRIKLSD